MSFVLANLCIFMRFLLLFIFCNGKFASNEQCNSLTFQINNKFCFRSVGLLGDLFPYF